ncbi:peptidoglycan-binding protein [Actinoplanes sp. NPDC026619]|uniref:peptidoglycan-binding protein n=1 Tax=Actinoplanes sp. NPDC026619 TaxID=3155798 RepID=UPI00340DA15B
MSAREMLNNLGTAVGGLIGWPETAPPADAATVRALFADLGATVGDTDEELAELVSAFQARVGLEADGVAGPRTIHLLVRYATEVRERHLDVAA